MRVQLELDKERSKYFNVYAIIGENGTMTGHIEEGIGGPFLVTPDYEGTSYSMEELEAIVAAMKKLKA